MKQNYDIIKQKITLVMERYGNDDISRDEPSAECAAIRRHLTSVHQLDLITTEELMDLMGYSCELFK